MSDVRCQRSDVRYNVGNRTSYILHIASYILLLLLPIGLQSQSFTVQAKKTQVVAGERFVISYILEGSQAKPNFPDFSPLKIEGGGPQLSTNFVMLNGRVSQSASYSFYLRAPKEGTYKIGPASVIIGGKRLSTQGITIRASKAPPIPDEGDQKGKDVFIVPVLSKEEVFVGERLTVTYSLFTRKNIRDIDLAENPVFDGFGVEENPNLARFPRNAELDGLAYRVVNIRQFHLFPQQAGEVNIPNLTYRAMIGERANPSRPGSVFNLTIREPRLITSSRKSVRVKPWPNNAPDDFGGLVGNFALSASLNRNQLNTGETVRLRVLISGEGNIRLQGIPKINVPESFDVFDPTPREAIRANAEAVNGEKVFDFLLAPRTPGTYQLPDVTVSYLNPETGTYDRLRASLTPLGVGGKALANEAPGVVSPELENDIRPLQNTTPHWYRSISAIWMPLAGLPFLLLAVFGFWINKRTKDEARPETALRRSMAAARKQLAEAHTLLEKGDSKGFYNELNRTLWAYLENRLELPGSSQTREALEQKLVDRTVSQDQQQILFRLLDESEMALYAPGAVAPPPDAYAQALDLLDQLESHFNPES